MNGPSYFSILTSNVRYDSRLNSNQKLLFSEITCLINVEGYCWAKDEYFANLYGVSVRTVRGWIKKLIDCGFLMRELIFDSKGGIVGRKLYLAGMTAEDGVPPYGKNLPHPMEENCHTYGKNLPHNINKNNNNIKDMINIDDDDKYIGRAREEIGKKEIVSNDSVDCIDEDDEEDNLEVSDGKSSINAELWLKRHVKGANNTGVMLIVHKLCYGNFEVLNYLIRLLDDLYKTKSIIKVKNEEYSGRQIRELLNYLDKDTFSRLSEAFYVRDEESRRLVRKSVSDPVAYIITTLKNEKEKPLRKLNA